MGSRRVPHTLLGLALAALLAACGTTLDANDVTLEAQARFGEIDNEHIGVGLLIFDDPAGPAWRCTGTLLTPTVLLTAGHCTSGAVGGRVWFETDVGADRATTGYPFAGGTSIEFDEIHTHPGYVDGAFFLHDLGLVLLDEPVDLPAASDYGDLPTVGMLDELATKRGRQNQLFTPVGYGLQSVKPVLSADLIRYMATVQLIDVKGTAGIPEGSSVMFTNSPGRAHRGGTCFGDSGGPIFEQDTSTIVAVTSFGLNQNCAGTGGGYRIDQQDDQDWINSFMN